MRTVIATILVCLLDSIAYPQGIEGDSIDVELLADEFLSSRDEAVEDEDTYEHFLQVLSSQMDLNSVTAEELRSLRVLTDAQVDHFIRYRREQGPLLDIHELQVIPGFDMETIRNISPFARVVDPAEKLNKALLRRIFSGGNSYLVTRYERTLEAKKGFIGSVGSRPFEGSPDKTYLRFRSSIPGDFSVGFTGEKDAGEKFSIDPSHRRWGFDYTSLHLQLRNKGKLKNLIAGDFQSQFGQGLVLGGGFTPGKNGQSIAAVRKSSIGFRPYTSVHESAYQRGLAVSMQPTPYLEISAFYSYAFRDASAEKKIDTVTSLQSTGYHRTANELAGRKKIPEQNAGFVISARKNRMDVGLTINYIEFGSMLRKTPTPYNQHAFTGSVHHNSSLFFNYRIENISFFSEVARSGSGGWAGLAGALMSLHSKLEVAMLYRNYGVRYHTFSSNAFSENTQPANEQGIYWGWKYSWNRRYHVNGYVDLFRFPWLGFRRYSPSEGYEWLMRANYNPTRKTSLFLQFRQESKTINTPEQMNLYKTSNAIRNNIAFQCDYGIGETVRLKTRIQYNNYKGNRATSEGWAFFQDLAFTAGPIQLSARHGLFHSDQYDNRHYVYENDAWLSYSLPVYSGVGVRNYVLFEYRINKTITIWLRYASTRMLNSSEVGSGMDAIRGNTRNDVKFQARIKF